MPHWNIWDHCATAMLDTSWESGLQSARSLCTTNDIPQHDQGQSLGPVRMGAQVVLLAID